MVQKINFNIGIGDNLRQLRKRNGLTQLQVIAKMELMGFHFPREKYIKMENNKYHIKTTELMALKVIFNAELDEFFSGIKPTPTGK